MDVLRFGVQVDRLLPSSSSSLWLHVSQGPLDLDVSDASCHGSADAPPPPPPLYLLLFHGLRRSGSWSMPTRTIHTLCHIYWMCLCNAFHLVTWHLFFCPSWRGILLCCSAEDFSTCFTPERFFSISWEFFLIRCEVKGQGCRMRADYKTLWGKFIICDIGLYKINWIESTGRCWRDVGAVFTVSLFTALHKPKGHGLSLNSRTQTSMSLFNWC